MNRCSPLPRAHSATWTISALLVNSVTRGSDYLALARPRIAIMVLITVSVGFALGLQSQWSGSAVVLLLNAWLGITLATAGSSALNQWIERFSDARMSRTMDRPLPSGRLHPVEVFWLGVALCIFGCAYLFWMVNGLTAVLTALTSVVYAFIYTPMKRWTSLCTTLGAIPGAMPPVLGWTAAGQGLDMGAFSLFGLLFFWQFPHFLAIAWLHNEDYLAAGLRMLPGGRPHPRVTGLMATAYALGLVPVSLIPSGIGLAGHTYFLIALPLGLVYLAASIAFAVDESRASARRLLWVSLIYLPVVLAALAGDHIRLLN